MRLLAHQQTRCFVIRSHIDEWRIDFFAAIDGSRATWMKAAAGRNIDRIGCFALQDHTLAAQAGGWVGTGGGVAVGPPQAESSRPNTTIDTPTSDRWRRVER